MIAFAPAVKLEVESASIAPLCVIAPPLVTLKAPVAVIPAIAVAVVSTSVTAPPVDNTDNNDDNADDGIGNNMETLSLSLSIRPRSFLRFCFSLWPNLFPRLTHCIHRERERERERRSH